ncbi:MAG: hypothetical protein ACJ75J_07900 [Cytophagaceae bacterium]|jgi:hypothetical protein
MDLRKIASELLNKNIMLCLRTNSPSFKKYGKQIRGKLTGQLWGVINIGNIYNETVTALTVIGKSSESQIPADDIDYIIEDKYAG